MNFFKTEYGKFFSLTFLCSWGFWGLPYILGIGSNYLQILGGLGLLVPSLLGIILAYLQGDKIYWEDFLRRIVNFRQIKCEWYWVILFIIPFSTLIALVIHFLISGTVPKLTVLSNYLENPLRLIPQAAFSIIYGPLAEEIGWRGFALDHLQKQYSWFISSVILGLFWALWHIPTFFIKDTYQYELLNDSFIYVLDFIIAFVPASIIMGWIYNNNSRSIFSGILFHFSINFFGEVINIPNYIKPYRTLVQLLIVLVIFIFWRKKQR